MKVALISHTVAPEMLAASAAAVCHRDESAVEILASMSDSDTERILDTVLASGHLSVVEHVSFTFAIDDASRILTHQLVRHRVGVAYSQQSQRYVHLGSGSVAVPPSLRSNPGLSVEVDQAIETALALYRRLLEAGVPAEDARYLLPQGIKTRLVMTANLRALIDMYRLDACLKSQAEIRELMHLMKASVRGVSPRLARELRIKCFAMGFCDEKAMCHELEGRIPRKANARDSLEAASIAELRRLETEVEGTR